MPDTSPAETDPTEANPAEVDTRPTPAVENLRTLDVRLARLEAQVRAHAEALIELQESARVRRQRGLWIRLTLLALALLAFFAIRAFGPGSAP